MSFLEPLRPSVPSITTLTGSPTQVSRATRRELAAIDQTAAVRIAAVDAATVVQQAKIDAVMSVAATTQQRAALLVQTQQQLALTVPAASGQLDFLGTVALTAVAQLLSDTARIVGRQ